ncbi:hypothetical protein DPX16_11751 [Anabarilius grahami]|uniref:Uncharacterized protein n=1 Tax=Anabarilius grahami TaxID=495550 RepID=A0A3N0Z801_ANAGA|nr:hypothetical protein DPX16_11751 [Anabarilius grahami]
MQQGFKGTGIRCMGCFCYSTWREEDGLSSPAKRPPKSISKDTAILDCRVALCNIVESTEASSRPQGPFNAAVFTLAPNLEDGNPFFHTRVFQSRLDIKTKRNGGGGQKDEGRKGKEGGWRGKVRVKFDIRDTCLFRNAQPFRHIELTTVTIRDNQIRFEHNGHEVIRLHCDILQFRKWQN